MKYICDRCHSVGEFKEGIEVSCPEGCVHVTMFPLDSKRAEQIQKEEPQQPEEKDAPSQKS